MVYMFKIFRWRAPKFIVKDLIRRYKQRCHMCDRRLDKMAKEYGSGGAFDIETHIVGERKKTVYLCNPCYNLFKK